MKMLCESPTFLQKNRRSNWKLKKNRQHKKFHVCSRSVQCLHRDLRIWVDLCLSRIILWGNKGYVSVCVRACVCTWPSSHSSALWQRRRRHTHTMQWNFLSFAVKWSWNNHRAVLALSLSLSLSQTMENNPRNEEDRLIVVRFRALLGPYGRPEESRIEGNGWDKREIDSILYMHVR